MQAMLMLDEEEDEEEVKVNEGVKVLFSKSKTILRGEEPIYNPY